MTEEHQKAGAENLSPYILAALENTTDAILITHLDGKALYINQSFGHFLGFTNLTKGDIDVYALHEKELVDHILDCSAQGLSCSQEVYLTHPSGFECPFQLRCSSIEDDAFEPQGICWISPEAFEH